MRKILQRNWLFIIISLFLMAFFSVGIHITFAQSPKNNNDPKIEAQSVNPGDDYKYVLKRLKEKIILVVLSLSPERKADYYMKLSGVRLAELAYVVDKKDIANIQTTSQRYEATAGELSEFVLKNNLLDYKQKVKTQMTSHIPLIEKMRDTYPYTSAESRFLQNDINSLQLYMEKLSQ